MTSYWSRSLRVVPSPRTFEQIPAKPTQKLILNADTEEADIPQLKERQGKRSQTYSVSLQLAGEGISVKLL